MTTAFRTRLASAASLLVPMLGAACSHVRPNESAATASVSALPHKVEPARQWLQAESLVACGQLEEALEPLMASVRLAETLGTPRELWIGKKCLGKLFGRLGRDRNAERQFIEATQTIEAITNRLTTPGLRRCFLKAEPIREVYRELGRRPPQATQ